MVTHAYFIESDAPTLGAGNLGLVTTLSRDSSILVIIYL